MPEDAVPIPSQSDQTQISVELIQKAVAWDKRKKVLSIKHHVLLKDIAEGRQKLSVYNSPSISYWVKKLISKGFDKEL